MGGGGLFSRFGVLGVLGVFIFRTTGSLFKRLETRTDEEGSTVFKKLGTGGGLG